MNSSSGRFHPGKGFRPYFSLTGGVSFGFSSICSLIGWLPFGTKVHIVFSMFQRASLRAERGSDAGINLWLDKQKALQLAGTEVAFVSLI